VNSIRLWIVVLGFLCFMAGTATGRILARSAEGSATEVGALRDSERLLASRFQLTPERARLLRGILEHYRREVESIKVNHTAAYRSAIEPELRSLGSKYNRYLRDQVLPPSERAKFDELSRGRSLNPSTDL
jgi:hypothetical protein